LPASRFACACRHGRRRCTRLLVWPLALLRSVAGCLQRPVDNPNVIVVAMTTGPNNLDPRVGTDDSSQKLAQLIFNDLMDLDAQLRVGPGLAERLDNPNPTTYVATLRRGVRFHDGHELTSADVVYTFRSFLDPQFISTRKVAFKALKAVDAGDRYTVVFTLHEPFLSFPSSLVIPVVPEGAGPDFRTHPIGTGPYRFVAYAVDDRLELAPFDDYFEGKPPNDGLVMRIIPDEIMRGLELKKGTIDLVVNDIGPDIVHQLETADHLNVITAPGTDYQYVGLNLRDPLLKDVRVRRALAYAIDRTAIVEYLRRGLATPAVGLIPPISWAFAPDVPGFDYNPARARELLDEAGFPDPDGDGPRPRFRLTLKASNVEFNRLQATVIQQDLQKIGVALDVRTHEFATLYADVLSGNFQMYFLQWVGGAVADPDILRQVFHSSQVPPNGFNRGFFDDPRVDALLDQASASTEPARRLALFGEVQHLVADDVPYISLWTKTNFAVAQRSVSGVHLSPFADFFFLKHVARVRDVMSGA
jgi:peptide/nickel transport system substrate-binding protein